MLSLLALLLFRRSWNVWEKRQWSTTTATLLIGWSHPIEHEKKWHEYTLFRYKTAFRFISLKFFSSFNSINVQLSVEWREVRRLDIYCGQIRHKPPRRSSFAFVIAFLHFSHFHFTSFGSIIGWVLRWVAEQAKKPRVGVARMRSEREKSRCDAEMEM